MIFKISLEYLTVAIPLDLLTPYPEVEQARLMSVMNSESDLLLHKFIKIMWFRRYQQIV